MIKYEGLSYDLDSLLEFHVLKKLLEALLKKQKLHDIILYGPDLENIITSGDNNQSTENNQKSVKGKIATFGLIKEFVDSQKKLKENINAVKDLKERVEILEKAAKGTISQPKQKNYTNRLSKVNNIDKNTNDNMNEKTTNITNIINNVDKEKIIKEDGKNENKENIQNKEEKNETDVQNNKNQDEVEVVKEDEEDNNSESLNKTILNNEEYEKKLKELEDKLAENLKKCENNEKLINIIQQTENELTQKLDIHENQINDLLNSSNNFIKEDNDNINNNENNNENNNTNISNNNNHTFDSIEKKLLSIIDSKIREKSNLKFNNFLLEYNKEKERIISLIEKNISDISSLSKKFKNLEKELAELPKKLDIDHIKDQIVSLNASIEDSVSKREVDSFVKQFDKYEKEIGKLKTYKVDQQKIEQKFKDQLTNTENAINNLKKHINSFSTLLGNKSFYEILDSINEISTKMVDIDDYNKNIDTINKTLSELKMEVNDHNRSIDGIMPRIENILTKEDLEKVENTANELIAKQNSNSLTKFADKKEIQKTLHSLETQIKIMKTELTREKENKLNTCMLSSKPVGGYKCASCETYIGELKESFQYLPWNKYPYQDMNNKPYNIGTGYSRILQSMNIERLKIPSHNKCEKLKRLSLVHTVDDHSISYDGGKNETGLTKYTPERNKNYLNSFSNSTQHKNVPVLRVVSTRHLKSLESVDYPVTKFYTENRLNLESPKRDDNYTQRMNLYENRGYRKSLKGLHTNLIKIKTKENYIEKKIDPMIIKPDMH